MRWESNQLLSSFQEFSSQVIPPTRFPIFQGIFLSPYPQYHVGRTRRRWTYATRWEGLAGHQKARQQRRKQNIQKRRQQFGHHFPVLFPGFLWNLCRGELSGSCLRRTKNTSDVHGFSSIKISRYSFTLSALPRTETQSRTGRFKSKPIRRKFRWGIRKCFKYIEKLSTNKELNQQLKVLTKKVKSKKVAKLETFQKVRI